MAITAPEAMSSRQASSRSFSENGSPTWTVGRRSSASASNAADAMLALRDFLYETVYERPEIRGEFEKAQRIISELWAYFHAHADEFRAKHWPTGVPESDGLSRAVADFITGMTDRYALRGYEEYFLPKRWTVL